MRSTGNAFACLTGVLLFLCGPLSKPAKATIITIESSPSGYCELFQPPTVGNVVTLYVSVRFTNGVTAAQFRIAPPSCTDYQIVSWASPNLILGDPTSGIQVAFGGCFWDAAPVMSIDVMRVGNISSGCCGLMLDAHPAAMSGMPEVVDCTTPQGNVTAVDRDCFWLAGDDKTCAFAETPSDPSPPDGATNVPVDVVLDATVYDPVACCPLLHGKWVNVYLGTNPDPPLVGLQVGVPYDPSMLSPGTKYYWRVSSHNTQAPTVVSPVWSFTTAATTPVRHSTWGAIKALYR